MNAKFLLEGTRYLAYTSVYFFYFSRMRMKNFSSLKMTKYEQCITGLAEKKKTFKIALSLKNICITVTEKKKSGLLLKMLTL